MSLACLRGTALLQFVCAGTFGWIAWSTVPAPAAAEVKLRAAAQRQDHRSLRPAQRDCADAFDAMAAALDPAPLRHLGVGLGETADYLDQQLAPAAENASQQLQITSERLARDARLLANLLRVTTLDLKIVKEVHDALGQFIEGTDALAQVLALKRLPDIRNGLHGLESALQSGAEQVEGLTAYTYPAFSFDSWKPKVSYKPFWPGGERIAAGMRDSAKGVHAADKELETLGKELPKVQTAIAASKRILERGRETLATILKHRDLIEPLVKSLPETAAQLADELPRLTKQLAAALHDTQRLRAVAAEMRKTRDQWEHSLQHWSNARATLTTRAAELRSQPSDETAGTLQSDLREVADLQAAHTAAINAQTRSLRGGLGLAALLLTVSGLFQFLRAGRTSREGLAA